MARQNYSRLAKTEQKKAVRSTAFYIVLTVVLLTGLLFFGVPLAGRVADIVSNFTEDGQPINQPYGPPPAPPRFDSVPEYTNSRKIVLKGSTVAGATVSISFNGETKEILSDASGMFSSSFDLKDGQNTFYASATDKDGQKGNPSLTYSIIFDDTEPKINIISPENGASFNGSKNKDVKIQAETEAGASVTINDRVAIVRSDGKFDQIVTLNEGENKFTIKSTDPAGNTTELEYILNYSN